MTLLLVVQISNSVLQGNPLYHHNNILTVTLVDTPPKILLMVPFLISGHTFNTFMGQFASFMISYFWKTLELPYEGFLFMFIFPMQCRRKSLSLYLIIKEPELEVDDSIIIANDRVNKYCN